MGGLMRQKNGSYRKKRRIQRFLSIVLTVLMIGVYPLETFAYEPVVGTEEEIVECQTAAAGERLTINGVVFEVIDASANTLRVVGYTSDMATQFPLGDDGSWEGTISYNGTTYTITEVADGAFANSSVKYISFPSTITSFGQGILDGCSNLQTVENDSTTVAFPLPELELGYVWYDYATSKEYTSIMNGVAVEKISKTVYDITFYSQGGTAVSAQRVVEGGCIEEPEAPEREGYVFKGWYTSSTCTGASFDFSTPVTRVYNLYAKWVEIKSEQDFIVLENGYSQQVTFQSLENKWYSFTPTVSGTYQMTTNSTYVYINYYETDYAGDVQASGLSFSRELEAGKTYYFRLYCNGSSAKTVNLTFAGTSAKAISTLDISAIPSYTYTGSAIKPTVTIKDGTNTLKLGTDYTVSYSNNTNAGTATVTINAAGSTYYGSTTTTFIISPAAAPSSVPVSAMKVSSNVKTVGDVSLTAYPNWSWQSADKTKALVSGGTVTAVAEYTGSDKANYKQTTVTVSITRLAPVVTDFELNATQIELKGGETFKLEVKEDSITPSDAVFSTVTYSSSDTKVATVGTDGTITAKATGTAVITAKLDSVTKTCTVSVTNPVSSFSLTKTNVSLSGGEMVTLNVTSIVPANHDNYSVVWSSDNESVAAVKETSDGYVVTAGMTGTAHITAVINGISRSCTIVVKNPLTDFALDKTTMALKGGEIGQLNITSVVPSKPDAYTVDWSSSNTDVAEVTNGEVRAMGTGTAEITATINGISITCTVSVTNPCTAFELSASQVTLIEGNTYTLSVASTTPENADKDYSISWISNREDVVTVSGSMLTALKEGSAVITARLTSAAGTFERTCTVTVNAATEKLTDITVEPAGMNLKAGETGVIQVTPVPEGASLGEKTYSSTNTSVAEVDKTGRVTAKKSGTAVITITAGGFTKQCTVTVTNPLTDFALNKTTMALKGGETEQLNITSVVPAEPKPDAYTVDWSSSNPDVAVVIDGEVRVMATGTARITATINGISRTCMVSVTNPCMAFELSASQVTLIEGNTYTLSVASTTPEKADNYSISWISNREDVVTVSDGGRFSELTALKEGSAIITARLTSASGTFEQTCTVTVNAATEKLTGITVEPSSMNLKAGDEGVIQVKPVPEGASLGEKTYSSTNTSVAEVDNTGRVTAKKSGTAVISITAGGFTKQCTVTVTNLSGFYTVRFMDESNRELESRENLAQGSTIILPTIASRQGYTLQWKNKVDGRLYNQGASVTVTGDMEFVVNARKILVSQIILDATGKTIEVNESFVLGISVKPDNALDRSVQWSSSNTKVATVDSNGRVTAVAAGTAVIKAAAKDGSGRYAVCNVTVTEPEPEYIAVESLKITGSTKKVAPGKKITLKVNVSPANADNQQVIWQVSNKKYASVNSKGVVTTKKAGKGKKVTVTAVSAENGSIKATYKISIMKNAVKKIKLTGKTTLKKGKSTTIKAKFTPAKNISKELTWTSSNKKIATVSSKGKVTAKKKGKVKITAKAKDGSGKKATITIRVK